MRTTFVACSEKCRVRCGLVAEVNLFNGLIDHSRPNAGAVGLLDSGVEDDDHGEVRDARSAACRLIEWLGKRPADQL